MPRHGRSRYRHWATKIVFDMGRRNFHGKIITLADSVEADYLVYVQCNECRAQKQMHPYTLVSKYKRLTTARLDTALPGFRCKSCRRGVSVTITCTYRRMGDF